MNILFDQGTPQPLKHHLSEHNVETAYEKGWSDLKNGDLLEKAEQSGYDLLVTTDQNLRYQQNLAGRKLAIVVLMSTSWPRIKASVNKIRKIVGAVTPSSYQEIQV